MLLFLRQNLMVNWVIKKYNNWLLRQLYKYAGVWLEPEPGIWGIPEKEREKSTLSTMYENDEIIWLLKKYAEQANKGVLSNLNQVDLGRFLAFNGLILRAKRAYKDATKNTP